MPAGGQPAARVAGHVDQRLHYVKQDGANRRQFAVRNTWKMARDAPRPQWRQPCELDLFVSHQANLRIILSATENLRHSAGEGVQSTSSVSEIPLPHDPLALNERGRQKRLKERFASSCVGRVRLRSGPAYAMGAKQ